MTNKEEVQERHSPLQRTANKYDGLWGRQIKALAAKQAASETTPRPWRWLPDEGQFIVAASDRIVAEIPCQGCNPADGELIVKAVNNHESLLAALRDLYNAIDSAVELTPQVLLRARAVLERVDKQ